MRTSRHFRSAHVAAMFCAAMALLPLAAVAAASAPIKGGSYRGTLRGRPDITLSFTVAKDGHTVTRLRTSNLPVYCSSGGLPVVIAFKNAKISSSGTFRSTAKQIISTGPRKGQVGATLSITGRFRTRHAESGTIKTVLRNAKQCSGSDGYSTTA